MTLRFAFAVCVLAACGKARPETQVADKPVPVTKPAAAAVPAAADPACAAKVKDLEPWLAKLDLERKSYEIAMGPELQQLDREPAPVPTHVDAVEVRKSEIRAWDIGEHDHASSTLPEHPTPAQLAAALAKMHDQKASPDAFEPAPDDLLRVDVARDAAWRDVAHVIDAATHAGYQRIVFAFTATSKLVAPAGVDDTTKTAAAAKAASDQLEALGRRCTPLDGVPLHHTRSSVPTDDAASLAKETAAAVLACNCAADPDELRKLSWIDVRWHQAVPRVGVVLALDANATTTLALPATTRWSAAYTKVVEALKVAAK